MKVALAAASEGTTRVVLDAGSATEIAFRRNLLEAIAKQQPWSETQKDPAVLEAFKVALDAVPEIVSFELEAGDPNFLLQGAELILVLSLVSGLSADRLEQVMQVIGEALAGSEIIAEKVDSLRVKLVAAH